MFIKYSSLEYSEFILAFQLQFGTYLKLKVNIFDGKRKNVKPVFKEILNNFYVFKVATYVEQDALSDISVTGQGPLMTS